MILGELGTRGRKLQELQSFDYELLIPLRSILVQERAQVARCVDAGGQARRVERHQGGERACHGRRPERVLQEHRGEMHCLPAKFNTDCRLSRRTVVAFVKQQVERAVDGWKTRGELGGRFSIAAWVLTNALAISLTLKPHRMWRTSATCASSGNRGWQQENIMRSRSSLIAVAAKSSSTRERPFALEKPPQFGRERARRSLAPQDIERAVLRGRHQPGGRIFRHAAEFPHLHRAAEGILHGILSQREVVDPEDPRQRGDHASRIAPEEMIAGLHLHVQLLDRAHFHRTSDLKDRTALRDFYRVQEIPGLDHNVAANDILSLGEWTVVDDLLFAGDNLAGPLQRMSGSLRWPFAPSSLNHATHFSIDFCICAGDAEVSRPRNR